MLICPNCGKENDIKSFYCSSCGSHLIGGLPKSMFETKSISDILFPIFLIATSAVIIIRLFLSHFEKLGLNVNDSLNITGILTSGTALVLSFFVKQPGWRALCIILSTLGILRFVLRYILDMF